MFGGDDGRLKYGPLPDHSPVIESLSPKRSLKIEPCFYFGEMNKNLLSGPTDHCDCRPFVPTPISTSHVMIVSCSLVVFLFFSCLLVYMSVCKKVFL